MNLTFLLRSGFGYMTQHIWQTTTYYEMPNLRRYVTKHNSNWKQQKQEGNNKKFKTKTYKKANLGTNLTNLYATKSVSHSKQKIRTDLPKVTSKDTRAAWADANQMY